MILAIQKEKMQINMLDISVAELMDFWKLRIAIEDCKQLAVFGAQLFKKVNLMPLVSI